MYSWTEIPLVVDHSSPRGFVLVMVVWVFSERLISTLSCGSSPEEVTIAGNAKI
jgi:hypothetical protein